jgi:hypothetical protein
MLCNSAKSAADRKLASRVPAAPVSVTLTLPVTGVGASSFATRLLMKVTSAKAVIASEIS